MWLPNDIMTIWKRWQIKSNKANLILKITLQKKRKIKKPAWHSPEIGTLNLSIEYSENYWKTIIIKKMTYCFWVCNSYKLILFKQLLWTQTTVEQYNVPKLSLSIRTMLSYCKDSLYGSFEDVSCCHTNYTTFLQLPH